MSFCFKISKNICALYISSVREFYLKHFYFDAFFALLLSRILEDLKSMSMGGFPED